MATQEKLLKSLESLRQLINSNPNSDVQNKKKEKIQYCNFIAESMLNSTIKIAPNFNTLLSFTIDVLLQLCDDQESDIRMTADECLNKIIRAMSNGSITKIQIELHKEIKKNGSARSLRAALWRFATLADHIRPHKGKLYVVNLIPCIVKIIERNEEIVHETLHSSLPKIMAALGCFTMDNDIKSLLKACLNNINSSSAVIRRTTSSCILTICLNCRKPYVFITYVMNNLIEYLVPLQDSHSTSLILGIIGCLKTILPHIKTAENEQKVQSSFGSKRDIADNVISVDRFLQVYELCLHYSTHSDHNIINASLETLNVLLQNATPELIEMLLSSSGITKSRVAIFDVGNKIKHRSPSQLSVATLLSEENLLVDIDLSDNIRTDIEKWIDESKLSVINVNYVKSSETKPDSIYSTDANVRNTLDNTAYEYSNISIGLIHDQYSESIQSESIVDRLEKVVLSEHSSEKSFSQKIEDKLAASTDILYMDIDIGDFLDRNIPLIYCARHLTKQFLLNGIPSNLIPDKDIRVSVKNLALHCLSSIIQLYPNALLLYLDKNCAKGVIDVKDELCRQQISDVLLFEKHCDPQLRGTVRVLIASFVRAVLVENCGNFDIWISENACIDDFGVFSMKNLVDIILQGLQDESSTCTKQTLGSLNIFLKYILESENSFLAIPILNKLPLMAKDPYWLVKVKLLDIITDLQYITIQHVTGNCEFQNKVVHNILFELLKDEDQRVRNATSNTIIRIIPLLYFEQCIPNESTITSKAIFYKNKYLPSIARNQVDTNINKIHFLDNMPFPFNALNNNQHCNNIEQSLSRIISRLFKYLLTTTSKPFIHGCIETLYILSVTYPTTVYTTAWGCFKNITMAPDKQIFQRNNFNIGVVLSIEETLVSSSTDLLNVCVHLLINGIIGYDLSCHLNLLKLSGNIFAGKAIENIKPLTDINLETQDTWTIFSDKNLSDLSEQFLTHIIKILNIFYHIIDDMVPTLPQNKPVLPNLPSASALSPIKRKKSDLSDKKISSPGKILDKDDKDRKIDIKINAMGYFASIPHYMKIYELLKTAYNNYKITLNVDASENFLGLLKTSLNTLTQVLEIATLTESGRIADEILLYLRSTFCLEPTSTVQCVQQLLKSLFGTNFTSDVDEIRTFLENGKNNTKSETSSGFYYHISQIPYNDISNCVNSLNNVSKVDCVGDSTVMGYLHRKEYKKTVTRSSDKILANYIRIFEPMVIKSLKQYTITSDVQLQCQVLQLLSQLVQLRVNYCLLDSEQIFIGFVLQQFEFIEEGQIPLSHELIPQIFQFLVHLSYGKQHSKSIIGIPKILQLCDGLMASGQSPITHCIPALKPVVEDVFLLRNKLNTPDFKELETTREVLVSMLLRLLEYTEIIELFALILNESKYCDNSERWSRWSKQIFDVFLPLLKHSKVRLDERNCVSSTRRLIFALHPSVFRNINEILIVLFGEPPSMECTNAAISRYLGRTHILLLILTQIKEEKLLLKILENQADFAPQSVFQNVILIPDPLNVTNTSNYFEGISPEIIFLRFLLRIIDIVVEKCAEFELDEEQNFLVQEFGCFLMYCLYIFQSGSHCKTTNMAISLINEEIEFEEKDKIPIDRINNNFLRLRYFFPLLTFEWCYILTLLNYSERKFWSVIMQLTESYGITRHLRESTRYQNQQCINLEIVRIGGSIVFCDYLASIFLIKIFVNSISENILTDGETMSWLLVNNIELIVSLQNEAPIFELLACIHRNSAASGLVLQAIATKCMENKEPTFRTKILKSIENVHSSQTGALIIFLVPKMLDTRQLAISRLATNLASRKIEYLLTLNMQEVNSQLPKDELCRIVDELVNMKLAKKHETLVSLLNKLSTQFYDLSPLEFDQRRPINPDYIKKLNISKAWYLSQVKSRCNYLNIGAESAELLNMLDYDELITIMEHRDFNKLIINDCIKWGSNYMKINGLTEETDLLKACFFILFKDVVNVRSFLPKPHQVFQPEGRETSPAEQKYTKYLTELLSDQNCSLYLRQIISPITKLFEFKSKFPITKIPEVHYDDFAKFAVICLETICYTLHTNKKTFNIDFISNCLTCADLILKNSNLIRTLGLNVHVSWLASAINSVYVLVSYLLLNLEPLPCIASDGLRDTLDNIETRAAGHSVYQLSVLVCWLESITKNCFSVDIPKCLLKSVKSIVISLARLPLVNSYILTPPTAWKSGWALKLSGPFNTLVHPLPVEYLQEIEILEEFIFRITLLGWTSRHQFEETWVCLLSVLSASPTEHSPPEEINAITHSTSLAVQAITSLLLQTLYYPQPGNKNVSEIIHVSRDTKIVDKSTSTKKLKNVHKNLYLKMKEHSKSVSNNEALVDVFNKSNIEKLNNGYSYSQLSTEYLTISAKIVEILEENSTAVKVYTRRENILADSGLDLNSCLQFLLDLYSQWIKSEISIPLRLLHEVVKSILAISDLFTDRTQFMWMLEVLLELSKLHMVEDEIIHQYLVIGICKAVAVLSSDMETFELVKRLVTQSLKSAFISARIASLHGLLYILQTCVLGNTVIGGISDEIQLFLPIAIEYVQCHLNTIISVLHQSQEHTLLIWSLAFFLIENIEENNLVTEFVELVINAAITNLSDQSVNIVTHIPLLKGLERLIIQKRLTKRLSNQVMKLALEKIKSTNPVVAFPAIQLLYSCMYTEYSDQLENTEKSNGIVQTNPDHLVQTIEKISSIFDRIKKGYPFEVDILCATLPTILNDFFSPSDILTKVISEFLSPQQRYPKQLSKVVFQIFEYAIQQSQLSLLQDWVVFSLNNFTQSFSIGMATWCLTCFFISASTNQWLRNMFPYVQSRVGRYEYEDRKMLCIAGADFYNNLNTDVQKKTFVDTFQKVKDDVDMPFNELLKCL